MTPDASGWRSSIRYAHVADMTASDVAWEWLRRNESYDKDFRALADGIDDPDCGYRPQHHQHDTGAGDVIAPTTCRGGRDCADCRHRWTTPRDDQTYTRHTPNEAAIDSNR